MKSETGSTMLETIFGVILLMVIAVGSIQVAFLLYSRNLVHASAHEAARAALVRGLNDDEARGIAGRVVHHSLGSSTRDIEFGLERNRIGAQMVISVEVRAVVEPTGPIPIAVPIEAAAELRTTAEPR